MSENIDEVIEAIRELQLKYASLIQATGGAGEGNLTLDIGVDKETNPFVDFEVGNSGTATFNSFLLDSKRGVVFSSLHDEYGGFPSVLGFDMAAPWNTGVALRPPDNGIAGLWFDRADGSKEHALYTESGQRNGNQDASTCSIRDIRFKEGRVREESLAENFQITRGSFRIEDDFLMDSLDDWRVDGNVCLADSLSPRKTSSAGGALKIHNGRITTPTNPCHTNHYNVMRALIERPSDSDVSVGLVGDVSCTFEFGDSVRAVTDDGTEESDVVDAFEQGQYLVEIRISTDGAVTYRIDSAGVNYHAQSSGLVEVAKHELGSGGMCAPTIEVTDGTAYADFVWCEGERTAA